MQEAQTIHITDLFISGWKALPADDAYAIVHGMEARTKCLTDGNYIAAGHLLNSILRRCIKPEHKKAAKQLSAEQKTDIYNDPAFFIHTKWYHFHIDKFHADHVHFVAPLPELEDTTYNQWKYIDAAFTKYLVLSAGGKESIEVLNQLIATIYTVKGQPFDKTKVEDYANRVGKKLYEWQKVLIAMTFANIRGQIIERYPFLFPKPDKSAAAPEQEVNKQPVFTGEMWHNMHFDLSETDAFKGFTNAGNAKLYDALYYLNKKAEENTKRKRS